MDGGVWWATVHGLAKSWTWLSDFTFFSLSVSLNKYTKNNIIIHQVNENKASSECSICVLSAPWMYNAARRIWPKRTGKNNDCLKENKWLNKFPIVSLIEPMWRKKKVVTSHRFWILKKRQASLEKKKDGVFFSLFYVRHCGMHFRFII